MVSILDRLSNIEDMIRELKNPLKYSAINKRNNERQDSRITSLQDEIKTLKILLGIPLE